MKKLNIIYRPGRENANADTLSRSPCGEQPMESTVTDTQVGAVRTSDVSIPDLLMSEPAIVQQSSFAEEQQKDPEIEEMVAYLLHGKLPECAKTAKKLATQVTLFALVNEILYFLDKKRGERKRCVVPRQLRRSIIEENHSGPLSGHFAGERLYKALAKHWWWQNMHYDVVNHCSSCPQCAIVNSSGRVSKPPLHPIPVQ